MNLADPLAGTMIVEQLSYEEWKELRDAVEKKYEEQLGYPVVVSFLRERQLISAIRSYREITHESLRESRDACLEMAHKLGLRPFGFTNAAGERR
jgi:hypothetical protein